MNSTESFVAQKHSTKLLGIGPTLTLWILGLFLATLVVFVGLDIAHETRVVTSLGATEAERAAIRSSTLRLHALHSLITAIALGFAVHFVIRRLLTRRVEALILAVEHYRRGIWRFSIPGEASDEIQDLIIALSELGPDLERKLFAYVRADRRALAARLAIHYEQSLRPIMVEIRDLAARLAREGRSQTSHDVARATIRMQARLSRLGDPLRASMRDLLEPGPAWTFPGHTHSHDLTRPDRGTRPTNRDGGSSHAKE